MSKNFSHLNTAVDIVTNYKGAIPLAAHLKNFFAQHKKYGSSDRRSIAHMCYAFYRTGKLDNCFTVPLRICLGLFLTNTLPPELATGQSKSWPAHFGDTLAEKLSFLDLNLNHLFPQVGQFSMAIDELAFSRSFLRQPKLFIRIRPGKHQEVKHKLTDAAIAYEQISHDCLAFENGTRLEKELVSNHEYVVQDYNSQRVFELVAGLPKPQKINKVWDCCAASGGKSIMAYDTFPNVQLTVSDVRPSILHNLSIRLQEAGIKCYQSFVADLTNKSSISSKLGQNHFDLVICDAPCSGSGTWSRTPEQLAFFKRQQIDHYSSLQQSIAGNAIAYVKQHGYLLYITCSVFKEENEDVVHYLQRNHAVELIEMRLFTGYHQNADTMFAALFKVV